MSGASDNGHGHGDRHRAGDYVPMPITVVAIRSLLIVYGVLLTPWLDLLLGIRFAATHLLWVVVLVAVVPLFGLVMSIVAGVRRRLIWWLVLSFPALVLVHALVVVPNVGSGDVTGPNAVLIQKVLTVGIPLAVLLLTLYPSTYRYYARRPLKTGRAVSS